MIQSNNQWVMYHFCLSFFLKKVTANYFFCQLTNQFSNKVFHIRAAMRLFSLINSKKKNPTQLCTYKIEKAENIHDLEPQQVNILAFLLVLS